MSRAFPLRVIAASAGLLFLAGCATSLVSPAKPLPKQAIPPVVAVSSFEDRSDFAGGWSIGSGVADLLVTELVRSRNFKVVERGQLDRVVGEIQRQRTRLFRPEGRVQDGRLKNAEYMVRGVINDFSQVGGGALTMAWRTLIFGGRGYRARVGLTLTIVEVESGEIVSSVHCFGIARARQAYAQAAYRDVTFGGEKFSRTPLGVATINAVRTGVKEMVEKVPRTYWRPMIADVEQDGRLVINGGKDRDVEEGALFDVREKGRPVTDPRTGDVLSVVPGRLLGIVRITTVGGRVAWATPVRGAGFARGQYLRPRME